MQALLQYQLGETGSTYGDIPGSCPDWAKTNLKDKGKSHKAPPSMLSEIGLHKWHLEPATTSRPSRRKFDERVPVTYAEPIVHGAKGAAYYERRAQTADGDYRRSQRYVADPGTLRMDRPEGRRQIPEPKPPGPLATGPRPQPDDQRNREAGRAPEPPLPRLGRLGRPPGINSLRESDQEISFERLFGRKHKVDQGVYQGQGRAGDKTGTFGPPARPEDDPDFFKSLKDTPTFIRFCSTLPAARLSVSSHERRRVQQWQDAERAVDVERRLVASLNFPEGLDD